MWMRRIGFILALLLQCSESFAPIQQSNVKVKNFVGLKASIQQSNNDIDQNYVMPADEIHPILTFGEAPKEKIVNAFGMLSLAMCIVTGPVWMLAMSLIDMVCSMNDSLDPNRVLYDGTGKIWSRTWLSLLNSFPTMSGELDAIKSGQGPCLYVANHASWMDIPVLCTVLDPVFKFIAKAELKGVPCIGQQLVGGKHILIDRDDRRSQLRTFKEGVNWLKKGVPLMAFPEGMRSNDGRLMEFKGGIFSMAVKAGVPIVPISISHTHAIMPPNALLPIQPGRGKLHLHVHKPVNVEGKTDAELAQEVRQALLSQLPACQHPIIEPPPVEIAASLEQEQQKEPVGIQVAKGGALSEQTNNM